MNPDDETQPETQTIPGARSPVGITDTVEYTLTRGPAPKDTEQSHEDD